MFITYRRALFVLVVVLLALLVALPTAAQDEGPPRTGFRPDAPPYAIRGPHPVGYMSFDDGAAERPMTGGIWYPALNPEGVEEACIYEVGIGDIIPELNNWAGRAIRDAAPDTAAGPYPLVVFSHGASGTLLWTVYLSEHLASHGFVVMAMNHTGDTLADVMKIQSEEQFLAFMQTNVDLLVLRPLDISQTLDHAELLAETGAALAGVIDMDRVAVGGISYGGYSTLMAGGARLQFPPQETMCDSERYIHDGIRVLACERGDTDLPVLEAGLMALAGIESEPGQLWPSLGDPRVDVIVALEPGAAHMIADEGFANIQIPMLLFMATGDTVVDPVYNGYLAWEFSGSPRKALVELKAADHFAMGRCSPEITAFPGFFGSCSDPVWDLDRSNDLVNHFTTAFLLAQLCDDAEAAASLAPEMVSFPGVTYETQGF
jgi:predicted dienelactone hydrolase